MEAMMRDYCGMYGLAEIADWPMIKGAAGEFKAFRG